MINMAVNVTSMSETPLEQSNCKEETIIIIAKGRMCYSNYSLKHHMNTAIHNDGMYLSISNLNSHPSQILSPTYMT
jgi:hypothetical protein